MPGPPPGTNTRPERGPGNRAAPPPDDAPVPAPPSRWAVADDAVLDIGPATLLTSGQQRRAGLDRGLGDRLARTEQDFEAGLLPEDERYPPELIGPDGEVLEWSTPWAAKFLDIFAKVAAVTTACKAAGVHPNSVTKYRKRSRRFNQAMALAVDEAADVIQNSLYQRAVRGDNYAARYWLENVARHRFGPLADAGGTSGGQLKIVMRWPATGDDDE